MNFSPVILGVVGLLSLLPFSCLRAANFESEIALECVTFKVEGQGDEYDYRITIIPSGLVAGCAPIRLDTPGSRIASVEICDINGNGSPVLFVFLRSLATDSRMSIVAYALNQTKSLSPVVLADGDFGENFELGNGYTGHDYFGVVDGYLLRRFPVFHKGAFIGTFREIRYKMDRGTIGQVLRPYDSVEYAGS
jgi:hypothetical protein